MLHAFLEKKSNAYQHYMGIRESGIQRVSSEDEITSIIFGPLDFLTVADNWLFWEKLLSCSASLEASGGLPLDFFNVKFSPVRCQVRFWRRRNGVEPDLLIRFFDASNEQRSLLIEIKWDSRLSGDDQLEKQWNTYQKNHQENSLHVFIAKDIDEIYGNNKLWISNEACRLRGVRWSILREEASKLHKGNLGTGEFRRWAGLIDNFLDQIGIHPFVGFSNTIGKSKMFHALPVNVGRFWTGFTGFKNSLESNHIPLPYTNFRHES